MVDLIASVAVALPLIFAGVAKLSAPSDFAAVLANYKLLGGARSQRWTLLLGTAECAAGTLMIVVPSAGLAAAVCLIYATFAGFMLIAIRAGATGDCGCFGAVTTTIGRGGVLRATGLALAAATLTATRLGISYDLPELASRIPIAVAALCGCWVVDAGVRLIKSGSS